MVLAGTSVEATMETNVVFVLINTIYWYVCDFARTFRGELCFNDKRFSGNNVRPLTN
jgi:hypothetical protein